MEFIAAVASDSVHPLGGQERAPDPLSQREEAKKLQPFAIKRMSLDH
jgi:hypothetical protein